MFWVFLIKLNKLFEWKIVNNLIFQAKSNNKIKYLFIIIRKIRIIISKITFKVIIQNLNKYNNLNNKKKNLLLIFQTNNYNNEINNFKLLFDKIII